MGRGADMMDLKFLCTWWPVVSGCCRHTKADRKFFVDMGANEMWNTWMIKRCFQWCFQLQQVKASSDINGDVCQRKHGILCLLKMHHTLFGNVGHGLWNRILADVFRSGRRDQRCFYLGMLLVTLSFRQREAPVAGLSVAANSRAMSRCHTKDEMFSLSLVFPEKS